jgi:pimeloyl-ACP methyl ester carboxylesterase
MDGAIFIVIADLCALELEFHYTRFDLPQEGGPMKRLLVILAAAALASCGSSKSEPEPTIAMFDLGSESLFDVPFPSEVRRTEMGGLDLSLFPNPRSIIMVEDLKDAVMEDIEGFGLSSVVYFRFSAPIDTGTLPVTYSMSREPMSSVQLMNVDPSSPDLGERVPIQWHYREEVSDFWSPHTLAILPVSGYVLRPDTLYAAFLFDSITDAQGDPVIRDAGFETMVDNVTDFGPVYTEAEHLHREAMRQAQEAGLDPSRIVSAAVYRTQDPVTPMERLRDHVQDDVDPPEVVDIELTTEGEEYVLYTGHYAPNPIYQEGFSAGLSPYLSDGGRINFDGFGEPVLDGEETMRFALTIPPDPMPPGGWPIVLYAHGTGGDYMSFTRNGAATVLAARGLAVLGIDNAMNGERIPPDGDPDTLFFNVSNIWAARDNVRQAAVDVIQLERLVPAIEISDEISHDATVHTLAPTRITYMGHSQGGLNGALYLAVSTQCEGAYLSGAGGGLLYSLTTKSEPINIRNIIGIVMGFTGSTEELDAEDFGIFHPTLNLVQIFYESADGVNYARHWFAEPLSGVPPKHILMSEGMDDSYSPAETIEPLATAGELDPVLPVEAEIPGMTLKGHSPLAPPVTGNAAMGTITTGLVQYPADPGYDGHFVAYHHEGLIETYATFLQQLSTGTAPTIDR